MANSRTKRDFYEILGVNKNCSAEDIKRAFRALAKKKHPDITKNPNDAEEFKKISEAYEILSDPEKRKMYDAYGHEGVNGAGAGFGGFQNAQGFSDINNFFEDFLGDIFGGQKRGGGGFGRQQGNDGPNYLKNITIDLADAVLGTKYKINLNIEVPCNECHQTGARTPQDYQSCPDCHGKGVRIVSGSSIFGGAFKQQIVCNTCQGIGKIIRQKCLKCKGNRFYLENQTLQFEIPPSTFTGEILTIKGKGGVSRSGSGRQGDLIIKITVRENRYFTRQNYDLVVTIPVSYTDALIGKEITIPCIDGELIKKTLPHGIQDGEYIIIPNQGCWHGRKRGNLFAVIKIKIPKRLSKQETELITKISDESNFNPNEEFIKDFARGK